MGDQIRIPRVVITSFFSSFPFEGHIIKRLQNSWPPVVPSISRLFVPHFNMSAFTCIYLQHRINNRVVKTWNSLPLSIREATSVNILKALVRKFFMD